MNVINMMNMNNMEDNEYLEYLQHIEDIETQTMENIQFDKMFRPIYHLYDAYKFIKNHGILCFFKNMFIHFTRVIFAMLSFSLICLNFMLQLKPMLFIPSIFFSCVFGIISSLMFTKYKMHNLFDSMIYILFFIIISIVAFKTQNN